MAENQQAALVASGITPEGEANPHPIPPSGGFSRPPDGSTYRDGYRAGLIRGYVEGREDEADGEPMPEWAQEAIAQGASDA